MFVSVDPGTLQARLRAAGFTRARVAVMGGRLKFAATKDPGYKPHLCPAGNSFVGHPAAGEFSVRAKTMP